MNLGRVANLEEWARVAPLNGTEYKLLLNYNEKPVLTRPQQVRCMGTVFVMLALSCCRANMPLERHSLSVLLLQCR